MRISSRAHYGLRMMTELAKSHGGPPLSLAEIARRESMPLAYLEQLVAPLRRAGVVEGTRGLHGGYRLARPPGDVTVLEIVELMEGPVVPVECLAEGYRPGSCGREPECLSRPLWGRLQQAVRAVLGGTTLADLMREPWPAEPGSPVARADLGRQVGQTVGV
jgi:Rrf2 family cysteine metabolism transcriptional repressor